MSPLAVSSIGAFSGVFVFWGAIVVIVLGLLGLIPILKIFPRARYYGGMGAVTALAVTMLSRKYVPTSPPEIAAMLLSLGLGWWYAWGGVKHWSNKLKYKHKALEHSSETKAEA